MSFCVHLSHGLSDAYHFPYNSFTLLFNGLEVTETGSMMFLFSTEYDKVLYMFAKVLRKESYHPHNFYQSITLCYNSS